MRKALSIPATFLALAVALVSAGCSAGAGHALPGLDGGVDRSTHHSRALPGGCSPISSLIGCTSLPIGSSATATYTSGFTPQDIQAHYSLPSATAVSATAPVVAIVSAYDTPNAESDLAVYRARFNLPPCGSSNGCFRRVAQDGTTTAWPGQDATWNAETMLDLEMASAACPGCRLLLVEAGSNAIGALAQATNTAAKFVPGAISESFGRSESLPPLDTQTIDLEPNWRHPGIPIVASSGDSSTPTFPATSQYVIAVGGTQWTGAGQAESTWSSSGAGCSRNDARPAWQTDSYGCTKRGVADILALAAGDSGMGVATYNSNSGGWSMMIGTSVGTPIVAALFAEAHDYPQSGLGAGALYPKRGYLKKVPSSTCTLGLVNCTVYGLGSPNGLSAF